MVKPTLVLGMIVGALVGLFLVYLGCVKLGWAEAPFAGLSPTADSSSPSGADLALGGFVMLAGLAVAAATPSAAFWPRRVNSTVPVVVAVSVIVLALLALVVPAMSREDPNRNGGPPPDLRLAPTTRPG